LRRSALATVLHAFAVMRAASLCLAGCAAIFAVGCRAELGGAPSESSGGGGDGDGSPTAPPSPASCERADILFAVDNSGGSMAKEQQALRDAFPVFARAMNESVGEFRVGLVDGCAQSAVLHTTGMTQPCNFAGGRPWIESTSPFLDSEFNCVANVDSRDDGCNGNDDDEQPVTSAASALESTFADVGRVNAGFRRDDALLVVIAVTDEDEQPEPTASAQNIYSRLIAHQHDGAVLFLGAGGSNDCEGPYGPAEDADTLHEVTDRFGPRGVFSDLCAGGIDQGLQKLVETVQRSCE
jgi:hypothetical protein